MKILHIVPTYLPAYRYGGPIQSVHALNKYLVRAGAEVEVYTTAIDGPQNLEVPLEVPVDRDGVKVHYFKPEKLRSWFYAPGMRRGLRAHAKDFDVIHITSVFLSASTLGARAAQAAARPYMVSPRGSLMLAPLEKKSPLKKSIYLKLIERSNLEKSDAIHFTSEQEKVEYEKLGISMRKAFVIPNGLDQESLAPGDQEEFRKKFNISKEKRIVLFLGRLSWKKGLDTLIPAFAEVAKQVPEAVLVLAGGDDENYQPELEKLIDSAGIRGKVIFTGAIGGPAKTGAFRSAEVFVLSSYSENFGITILEAMHFGVPVILSEEVALAPVVRESGAGLVVKKDAAELSAAMLFVLQDASRSRLMGGRGIVTAEKFSYVETAKDFLEAYNELTASHRNHG